MPDEAVVEHKPRRRIARSGPVALGASLLLIGWVVLFGWLTIESMESELAGVLVTIMFFASWLVVPVLAVAVVVFAILALLFNPVYGKILGALAVVLPVVGVVLFWNSLGAVDTTIIEL